MLRLTFAFFFLLVMSSNQVVAHTFDGTYLCKESAFSIFRSKVIIKNMKKIYFSNGSLKEYLADVYFKGKILERDVGVVGEKYTISWNKKRHVYIELRHDNNFSLRFYGPRSEGVKFIVEEEKFSEESGTKWETTRSVFCEEQ